MTYQNMCRTGVLALEPIVNLTPPVARANTPSPNSSAGQDRSRTGPLARYTRSVFYGPRRVESEATIHYAVLEPLGRDRPEGVFGSVQLRGK